MDGIASFFCRWIGHRIGWTCLLASLTLLGTGCRQVIQAGRLPREYAASGTVSARHLDLARLSPATVGGEQIQAGDVLEVVIATGLEDSDRAQWPPLRVDERGMVLLPIVGPVQVAGLSPSAAEHMIGQESVQRGIFRHPQVSVTRLSRKTHRVTVVGAVEEPGVKEIDAVSSDLMSALVAAGGLSEDAGTLVEVRQPATAARSPADGTIQPAGWQRPSEQRLAVDLSRPAEGPLPLNDGAVVNVMRQPDRFVHVLGLVNKPDQVEIPAGQELRLLDAISRAGGLSIQVADKIRILRQVPGQAEPVVIAASFRDAKKGRDNIRLAEGDIVSVEETPLTFTVEMLRSFVRFGFSSAVPGI